ncbi:MAG: DUF1343 domain-containing protein [Deltaproteobacteria bacterium]|nr:DUF1343 domain-containing protein [Deltaproteobacteria bacterium]
MRTPPAIRTGLENFLDSPPDALQNRKWGLLYNPASVDPDLRLAPALLHEQFPENLVALFTPQHGIFAAKQDNMVESEDATDPETGLPAYSLYSKTRVPTDQSFAKINALVVDLLDVGTRVYTFMYTLSHCMEKAAKRGIPVVVLDRPNPIGGTLVEGGILDPAFASFVGRFPIPMRHGLTMGELARLFNEEFGIGCDLTVVPMSGWSRDMLWEDTGLFWVPPSPNLPQAASALVYPGQVLWEGTNVSEARGTAMPFLMCGAPFVDPGEVLARLSPEDTAGVILRPCAFEPTSNKWEGALCAGFSFHVTDPKAFRPVRLSLRLLEAVCRLYPKSFAWKQPPYEYEYERMPIDLILGTDRVRKALETGEPLDPILADWEQQAREFEALSAKYRLYPEGA